MNDGRKRVLMLMGGWFPAVMYMQHLPDNRMAFLTTGLGYGGAESQLVQLAVLLKARGWDVEVISMLEPKALVDKLLQAAVPVVSLKMAKGVPDPRALLKLAVELRRFRPGVLHSHMVHANLLARLTRLLYRVPVLISTAHSIDEGGRLRELAYGFTDRLCDLTTNVSQAAVDRYVEVGAAPKGRIICVPNGIDTEQFRPNAERRLKLREELGVGDSFVWLAAGRFEPAKDHASMIAAYAELLQRYPESLLLLAGQGNLEQEVKALASAHKLSGKVRFLGVRQDIPALMNAADAYVMSSVWEGLPMVLLEAAASGLPVAATDVGGNREVIIDGSSGHLVPPQRPEELGAAMERVMAAPEAERQAMGMLGRSYVVENYSLDHVVTRWETIYRKLLKEKSRSKWT